MEPIVYEIDLPVRQETLDLSDQIAMTCGDNRAHQFVIRLMEGGETYDVSAVHCAKIVWELYNGSVIRGEATILEDRLYYDMMGSELTCPGIVKASLQLFGEENQRLTSGRFCYLVKRDPTQVRNLQAAGTQIDDLTMAIEQNKYIQEALLEWMEDADHFVGPQGPMGVGLKLLGAKDSEAELLAQCPEGETGDAYLVEGCFYVFDGNRWINAGNVQGVQGQRGEKGETGAEGIQGPKGDRGLKGEQGPVGAGASWSTLVRPTAITRLVLCRQEALLAVHWEEEAGGWVYRLPMPEVQTAMWADIFAKDAPIGDVATTYAGGIEFSASKPPLEDHMVEIRVFEVV